MSADDKLGPQATHHKHEEDDGPLKPLDEQMPIKPETVRSDDGTETDVPITKLDEQMPSGPLKPLDEQMPIEPEKISDEFTSGPQV